MGLLDRVFRRRARDLSRVDGPTRVELVCRVASPDVIASPVSAIEAALVRWTLLEEHTTHAGRGGGSERAYLTLARGLYESAPLWLAFEGQSVEVPLETAILTLVEDPSDGDFLSEVPPALMRTVRDYRGDRALAYREAFLRQGDAVRLTATIERVPPDAEVGYRARAGARPDFRALPDERIVVRELAGAGAGSA